MAVPTGVNGISSLLSANMALRRSICFGLSERMHIEYPSARKWLSDSDMMSKFLW